jgi:hypothetical protein
MNSRTIETDEPDPTEHMFRALADGTLSGLAKYHLWEMQLRQIRDLPEESGPDRTVGDG